MKETIEAIDHGEDVHCDDCNELFTRDKPGGQGGILFGSKAMCPDCAPKWDEAAKIYHEEHHIRARQPSDQTFWSWVMSLADGQPRITLIRTFTPEEDEDERDDDT